MNWIGLAFLAGVVVAVQALVNSRLGRELGNPMLATLASFAIGTVFVGLYCLAARAAFPSSSTMLRIPVWAWFGGVLGAFYVASVIITTPRIGAGALIGATITGQMAMAVTMDHFGWLGVERHPINPGRLLGVALLIAGALLLKRF